MRYGGRVKKEKGKGKKEKKGKGIADKHGHGRRTWIFMLNRADMIRSLIYYTKAPFIEVCRRKFLIRPSSLTR